MALPPISMHPGTMEDVIKGWECGSPLARYRGALPPRERDVLGALAAGASHAEMATQLGVRLPTVSTHLMRLYRRLGVSGPDVRAAAIARARHFGLLP